MSCFGPFKLWIAAAAMLASQASMGMVFRLQPCPPAMPGCMPPVLGVGQIADGDAARLRAAVDGWRAAGLVLGPLTMDSKGGSLAAAVALGLEIRRLGLDTLARAYFASPVADPTLRPLLVRGCHSSCVFAFLGGRQRAVESGAVLTAHRFNPARGTRRSSPNQIRDLGDMLRSYVQDMGVDARLVDLGMNAACGEVRMLRTSELSAWRVDSGGPMEPAWEVAQHASGSHVARLSKEFLSGKTAHLSISKAQEFAIVHFVLYYDPEVFPGGEPADFPLGSKPDVTFSTEDGRYSAQALAAWERKQVQGVTYYQSAVTLPLAIANQLRVSKSLRVQDAALAQAPRLGFEQSELSVAGLEAGWGLMLGVR